MKNLRKGFTLIELLVVIAIIGVLATTLAPKLREQLAKAKDAKAIAVLGAARTAGSVLYIDLMVQDTDGTIVTPTLGAIHAKLDKKAQELATVARVIPKGASRVSTTGSITYGGNVNMETKGGTDADDFSIDFKETDYSTEGKVWSSY